MSKTEKNAYSHKTKTPKLAIVSALLSVVSLLMLVFFTPLVSTHSLVKLLLMDISGIPGLVGLVLGIVALVQMIRKKRASVRGFGFAICGIVLGGFVSYFWLPELFIQGQSRRGTIVMSNLRKLGLAFFMYASDNNGEYPPADKWCDVLLEEGRVSEREFVSPKLVLRWPFVGRSYKIEPMFIWPIPKKGRCHFAMNPNCKPNSQRDVVLLFETKEGWNQCGGPELLSMEHHKGLGCCIVYNDAHTAWHRTHSLDELIGELKGKDSESTILKFK
jgi:hypothetical protein